MKGYGDVAVLAAGFVTTEGLTPEDAWIKAAREVFPNSKAYREKGCPKSAFLGLCAAGLVRGIEPIGSGSVESDNGKYAIAAAGVVRGVKNIILVDEAALWKKSLQLSGAKIGLTYNHQMEVVLKLADAKLLL